MFARKNQDLPGTDMPRPWIDKALEVLNSVYITELEKINKKFTIYGVAYPDELLLAIGLLSNNDLDMSTMTLSLSADLENNNEKEMGNLLNNLIDSAGVFFDQFFANPDWNDFDLRWNSFKFKSKTYYYSTSRENIALTLQANQLLSNK